MKQWIPKNIPYVPKKQSLAWEPQIFEENGALYVKLNPGVINNAVPINFNEKLTLPKTGQVYFIATVNCDITSDGTFEINSVKLSVSAELPAKISANKGSPPAILAICLGVYDSGASFMFYSDKITILPLEVFRTTKEPEFIMDEPFDRWYIWSVF